MILTMGVGDALGEKAAASEASHSEIEDGQCGKSCEDTKREFTK